MLAPLAPRDAHPPWFLALLVLLNVVDAFHLNIVWPMLPFAVRDFGVAEIDVGFYCGVIGAAAPLGALLSAYQWGRISDRYGCLLYTSPSPRDRTRSRMPSSA